MRVSDYKQAASHFFKNLYAIKTKRHLTIEEKFYAYQGVSFYRFYNGNFKKSVKHSKSAYEIAYSLDFKYGQVLALDLLGHSLCQTGHVHRGLYELQRALKLTNKIGNGGIETALKISIEKYRAIYGISIETTINDLSKAIETLNPQDTYSRAELHLELARQLILRGQGTRAQQILENAGEFIYKHQNKRQTAIFNHRYSHLLYLRGERHAGQALIRSLKSNLDDSVDHVIVAQVEGLERKFNQLSGASILKNNTSNNANKIRYTNFIDQRISNRELGESKLQITKGEDLLGDIMDQLQNKDLILYHQIKNLGLFGLLPKFFNIPQGTSTLYLGPGRSEIIVFNEADVAVIEKGITQPMKKLLMLINSDSFKSKEFLVENIWHYKYNPRIHDNVLYALIGKIRKLLGPYSNWIEWSNDGYRLIQKVSIVFANEKYTQIKNNPIVTNRALSAKNITSNDLQNLSQFQVSAVNSGALNAPSNAPTTITQFNIRQMKLLKRINELEQISVRDYSKTYKICTMTAFRDLDSLHKQGLLVRLGRGRSVVYIAPRAVNIEGKKS